MNTDVNKRTHHREVQESETEVVWTRQEARPRIRRTKDPGDGTTSPGRRKRGKPSPRWLDCVNRDMRAIGTTKGEVHDRTDWRRIVSAAAIPQPSGAARRRRISFLFAIFQQRSYWTNGIQHFVVQLICC